MPTVKVIETYKSKNCIVRSRPYKGGSDLD
jgi:hypothetical protein